MFFIPSVVSGGFKCQKDFDYDFTPEYLNLEVKLKTSCFLSYVFFSNQLDNCVICVGLKSFVMQKS